MERESLFLLFSFSKIYFYYLSSYFVFTMVFVDGVRIHYGLMNMFDEVWIVYDAKIRLSGKLSEKVRAIKIPAHYISLLSGFKNVIMKESKQASWFLLAVLNLMQINSISCKKSK
jgi:hypothetical protein